jgi:hypothetical protein
MEIKAAGEALAHRFGTDCEFEQSVQGWKNDTQILIRVSRTPRDECYEQNFCVDRPCLFSFDLLKRTIHLEP